MVRFGEVRWGLVRFGKVWFGEVRFGAVNWIYKMILQIKQNQEVKSK